MSANAGRTPVVDRIQDASLSLVDRHDRDLIADRENAFGRSRGKVSARGGPAHRGGSGAAGPWADAAWDEGVLKAPRNWLRKAFMSSRGAEWPGISPSCQCQEAICRNTDGSRAMIEIGTS